MSQTPPSYMDGIPVKISERFKPPPKITLPQSVIHRLSQTDGSRMHSNCYDFQLEDTVLKRISEWRSARDKEKFERDERVRLKEQERNKLAEEEQKRKLNQISYPNTDELSSASEDDASEDNEESLPSGSSEEPQVETSVPISANVGQYSHIHTFDTILIPTVLPDHGTITGVNVNSNVLTNFNIPKSVSVFNNSINNNIAYDKINYSDFENDTSSPFDNMELKTINDLDILAQVLNINVPNTGSKKNQEETCEEKGEITRIVGTNTKLDVSTHNDKVSSEAVNQQPKYDHQTHYPNNVPYQGSQQPNFSSDYYKSFNSYHYTPSQYASTSTTSAGCFTPTDSSAATPYMSGNISYPSQSQAQYPTYQQQGGSIAYNYYPYTSTASTSSDRSTYANSYFYGNAYAPQSQLAVGANYNYTSQSVTATTQPMVYGVAGESSGESSIYTSRSKSRSVPDIVRKLDEEVQDSAQRRTRNNSQSMTERPQDAADSKSDDKDTAVNVTQDFTLYNQLSETDKVLVKRIGSMGFPLNRVAAVLKRIGSNDKKIVEHLIPLSELLDLGFEEEKISEALLKFDNNKHKALDYLIL